MNQEWVKVLIFVGAVGASFAILHINDYFWRYSLWLVSSSLIYIMLFKETLLQLRDLPE